MCGLETSDTRGEGRCYFCVLTYRTDTKHTGKERAVKSETKQIKAKQSAMVRVSNKRETYHTSRRFCTLSHAYNYTTLQWWRLS